jgi:hypothetical protein
MNEELLLASITNEERAVEALLEFAVCLELETPASSFMGFCKRLDPAVAAMDSGKSLRVVIQNLTPAVDVLDDEGISFGKFHRFAESAEHKLKMVKRSKKERAA